VSAIASGKSPAQTLQSLGQWVAHVVVRDATPGADGMASEVPVGRGEAAWEELLAILEEMNYRGWLTVDRTQGEDKAGDAARAIRYLQSVFMG
jgi:sugar phosphate isomerase/epimerase